MGAAGSHGVLGEFTGSRRVLAGPVSERWPWRAAGRLRFLALCGHVGPVFGSLQLTPFKGNRENESRTGPGVVGETETQFCSWSVR